MPDGLALRQRLERAYGLRVVNGGVSDTIVVVVPVLGRPANAQKVADSLEASGAAVRGIFVASKTDPTQVAACRETGLQTLLAAWEPGRGDFAMKCNLAYRETTEPWIFQAADDVEFTPGWDVEALRVANETGAHVIGTNDDANPLVKRGGHSTHSLIRRTYVDDPGASADGPGTVFSEAYGHLCVDNELCGLAMSRGVWAFAAASVVRHHHPIFDRSVQRDATYEKGDATARADMRLFQRRRRAWAHPGRRVA